MKKLFLLASFLAFSFSGSAQADPKFMGVVWWHDHWVNQDFVPYYDNGTEPQNSQWSNSNWTPANWIQATGGGDGTQLVQRWQTAGIIQRSYVDGDVHYLDVGPNFYRLSGYDKRRVTETLDAIYQVTASKGGVYFLKDGTTDKVIGAYTKQGLNLE